MNEETNIEETEEEEKQLRETIENNMKKVRDEALFQGAKMVCGVVMQTINTHLDKNGDVSRRDLERCIKDIVDFVSVVLKKASEETEQKDSEEKTDDHGRED